MSTETWEILAFCVGWMLSVGALLVMLIIPGSAVSTKAFCTIVACASVGILLVFLGMPAVMLAG